MNFFGSRPVLEPSPKPKERLNEELHDKSAGEVFGFARRAAVEINKRVPHHHHDTNKFGKTTSISDNTERTAPTFSVSESLSEDNGLSYGPSLSSGDDSTGKPEKDDNPAADGLEDVGLDFEAANAPDNNPIGDSNYPEEEEIELSNQEHTEVVFDNGEGAAPPSNVETYAPIVAPKEPSPRSAEEELTKEKKHEPPVPPAANKENSQQKNNKDSKPKKVYKSFITNHPTSIRKVTSSRFDKSKPTLAESKQRTAIGTVTSAHFDKKAEPPGFASIGKSKTVDLQHTSASVETRMPRSISEMVAATNKNNGDGPLTRTSSTVSSPLHSVYSATTDYTDLTENESREQSLLDEEDDDDVTDNDSQGTGTPSNGSLVSEYFGGTEVNSPAHSLHTNASEFGDGDDDLIDELRRGFMDAIGCNFYGPYAYDDDARSYAGTDLESPSVATKPDLVSKMFGW